jgi:hypothetical protein
MSKFIPNNFDHSPTRRTDEVEDKFNLFASNEFISEYAQETGEQLIFKCFGDPFPDVVMEKTKDQKQIGVEFVEVALAFINQEKSYFEKKYLEPLYLALEDYRPRFSNVAITLQPSSKCIEDARPSLLPKATRSGGKRLVDEFRKMLTEHYSELSTTHGGLLKDLVIDCEPTCPELARYFDAVIINQIDGNDLRKRHPDDPVITSPSILYQILELVAATEKSLINKLEKGPSYETDLLVLHTLPAEGKPYSLSTAMHGEIIAEAARNFSLSEESIKSRFEEGWLLNAYIFEGKKLYRLW